MKGRTKDASKHEKRNASPPQGRPVRRRQAPHRNEIALPVKEIF